MAHDHNLRDMREHFDVQDEWTVAYRPLRPRTRKSGRRVTRTDMLRAQRPHNGECIHCGGGISHFDVGYTDTCWVCYDRGDVPVMFFAEVDD